MIVDRMSFLYSFIAVMIHVYHSPFCHWLFHSPQKNRCNWQTL
jgi:hypothetical protein